MKLCKAIKVALTGIHYARYSKYAIRREMPTAPRRYKLKALRVTPSFSVRPASRSASFIGTRTHSADSTVDGAAILGLGAELVSFSRSRSQGVCLRSRDCQYDVFFSGFPNRFPVVLWSNHRHIWRGSVNCVAKKRFDDESNQACVQLRVRWGKPMSMTL